MYDKRWTSCSGSDRVPDCSQIVRFDILVPNCLFCCFGAKLSGCQIFPSLILVHICPFELLVSNCPLSTLGAKLSSAKLSNNQVHKCSSSRNSLSTFLQMCQSLWAPYFLQSPKEKVFFWDGCPLPWFGVCDVLSLPQYREYQERECDLLVAAREEQWSEG